jgi:hypothetical protein
MFAGIEISLIGAVLLNIFIFFCSWIFKDYTIQKIGWGILPITINYLALLEQQDWVIEDWSNWSFR